MGCAHESVSRDDSMFAPICTVYFQHLTAQKLGTFATEAEGLRRVSAHPLFVLVLWLWGFRGNGEWRVQSICDVLWQDSAHGMLPISHLFQR
jgi:hypothetical protein